MTATELFELPENDRIDRRLIRGRLVERPHPLRSPSHAIVVANLAGILGNWRRNPPKRNFSVFGYGCPFRLERNPDSLVCFDSAVILKGPEVNSRFGGPGRRLRSPGLRRNRGFDDSAPATRDGPSRFDSFIDGQPAVAFEIIDDSDCDESVSELVDLSEKCGVALLCLVDPLQEFVELRRPGRSTVVLSVTDDLDASSVVPDLRFAVSELFE